MNITDIRIRKTYHDARLKALVSVTIDGDLAVCLEMKGEN